MGNAQTDKSNPGFEFSFHEQLFSQVIDLLGTGGGPSQSVTAGNLFKISEFDFYSNGMALKAIPAEFPPQPFGLLQKPATQFGRVVRILGQSIFGAA